MSYPPYDSPPIVEAVAEVVFANGELTPSALQQLALKLAADYPGEPQLKTQVSIVATLQPGVDGQQPALTTQNAVAPQTLVLSSADGNQQLNLSVNRLSVHGLRPYPGWDRLRRALADGVHIYKKATGATQIARVAVRYIDRIALPKDEGLILEEYFITLARRPVAMGSALKGFSQSLHTFDTARNVHTVLHQASGPPTAAGAPVILFDLNILSDFSGGIDDDAWLKRLDELHTLQREIFEQSITDRTRALFRSKEGEDADLD